MSTAVGPRHQAALAYTVAAGVSVVGGLLVARSQRDAALAFLALATVGGAVALARLPIPTLFLGWLALAPLLADSTRASHVGRVASLALYTVLGVVLALMTLLRSRTHTHVSFIDIVPGVYVGYVLLSIVLTSDALQTSPLTTIHFFFQTVVLGPVVYYFLTIGPGAAISRTKVMIVLLASGALQGVLALVEAVTHRNVWGFTGWQGRFGGSRAVSTLANPAILGTFLGIAIVIALVILTWGGPRSMRRLSIATLVLCVPALMVTLTRGPILATGVAAVLVLLLGHRRVAGAVVLAWIIVLGVIFWPSFRGSAVYQKRASNVTNIEVRAGLQKWSLNLASERPLFGWGYGSFDRVKNTADLPQVEGISDRYLLQYTSHNSYLTMLVELGSVGLLLYALPFLVMGAQAVSRARAPTERRWLVAAALASLVVIVLSASTLDFRFFSFAQVLPWLFLVILRDAAKGGSAGVEAR